MAVRTVPVKGIKKRLNTRKKSPCQNLTDLDKDKGFLYRLSNRTSNLVCGSYYGTKKVVSVTKEKVNTFNENRNEKKATRKADKKVEADRKTAIYTRYLGIKKKREDIARNLKNTAKKEKAEEKAKKTAIRQAEKKARQVAKEEARNLRNKKRQEKNAISAEKRRRFFGNMKKFSKKVAKGILFSPILVPAAVLKISAKLAAMGAKALWKKVIKPIGKSAAQGLRNGKKWMAGTKLAKNVKSGIKSGKEGTMDFFRGLGVKNKEAIKNIMSGFRDGRTASQTRFATRGVGRD